MNTIITESPNTFIDRQNRLLTAPRVYRHSHAFSGDMTFGAHTEARYRDLFMRNVSRLFGFKELGKTKSDESLALLAECLIQLALHGPLQQHGLSIDHAPSELERGDPTFDDKGYDLIISQPYASRAVPMLAINAKLSTMSTRALAEGYRFANRIASPYVRCSMGDLRLQTKNGNVLNYREWAHNQAVPALHSGDHIPALPDFRRYIAHRMSVSLDHYEGSIMMFEEGTLREERQALLIPDNQHALEALKIKVVRMKKVMEEITGA